MLTFARFTQGLFLPQDQIASPQIARLAYLPANINSSDPITLEKSWSTQSGFYAFFIAAAGRDWDAFQTSARAGFQDSSGVTIANRRFGWFETNGQPANRYIPVVQAGADFQLPTGFNLPFRNIQVLITSLTGNPTKISLTDDTFSIENKDLGLNIFSVALTVTPPGAQQATLPANSNLSLPMTGDDQGTLQFARNLNDSQMSLFEAGNIYYEQPATPNTDLTTYKYPVFRTLADQTALALTTVFDFSDQENSQRTFFQFTDAMIGSNFVTNLGRQVAFVPMASSTGMPANDAGPSRMALINRPKSGTSDQRNYALAPVGSFAMAVVSGNQGTTAQAAPAATGEKILCAFSGPENIGFSAGAQGTGGDALNFIPGQAALRVPAGNGTATSDPASPFLNDGSGNVTTSWVQVVPQSVQSVYFSQPEDSPLYVANAQASSNGVNLLGFKDIAVWPPAGTATATAITATPVVPMVPYQGLNGTSSTNLERFRNLELDILNPARRAVFLNAGATARRAAVAARAQATVDTWALTPQGLLAGLANDAYNTLRLAKNEEVANQYVQMTALQTAMQEALLQNQIFLVISSSQQGNGAPQFIFSGPDQQMTISDWTFDLSPDGAPDPAGNPPVLIIKFYKRSIRDLVDNLDLWATPNDFNANPSQTQTFLKGVIQDACTEVFGAGNCQNGVPTGGSANSSSLYAKFFEVVSDPNWNGILALNDNIDLTLIPPAIQSVLGGMRDAQGNSNLKAFRAHHLGIEVNDIDPANPVLTISQSSLFGLIDYEKPAGAQPVRNTNCDQNYAFEVEFLRVLFANSEVSDFACVVNLTIDALFQVGVTLQDNGADATDNTISITGKFQNTNGEGIYSFINEANHVFKFVTNQFLQELTLTKIQLATQNLDQGQTAGQTLNVASNFALWGSMVFNVLPVLDVFSFSQLSFANTNISMSFDLTLSTPPTTTVPCLNFVPDNLRFNLANSPSRDTGISLTQFLPLQLRSFIFARNGQSPKALNYFPLAIPSGVSAPATTFTYALIFELDLGSIGALVGSLAAFKFSILVGWQPTGGLILGLRLPEANGKLEINIEGVLKIVIEQFVLQYGQVPYTGLDATNANVQADDGLFVLGLLGCSVEVLGKRIPPSGKFNFALFAPSGADNFEKIGWFTSLDNRAANALAAEERGRLLAGKAGTALAAAADDSVFKLNYVGLGQRVGPSLSEFKNFNSYDDFLEFMTTTFNSNFKNGKYNELYQPGGGWLFMADFGLLGVIDLGFVFYDAAPFYSLSVRLKDLFNFDISYKKVSDEVGVFLINLSLPPSVRTFQVGAASVRVPDLSLDIFTNGDWKVDVGFPRGDDWSRSLQIQAQAGPVPVTGGGGFYLAKLSAATSDLFQTPYDLIVAFGFACRLGVGKDFTAGIFSAGISVTFFGIIEGAAAYNNQNAALLGSGALATLAATPSIFQKPDGLFLKGELGIIGELYGSVDFGIVKASVNVRLSASIGAQILVDGGVLRDLTLYIQASVSVGVKVQIKLWIVKITISFSFKTSIKFSWTLTSGGTQALMAGRMTLRRLAPAFEALAADPATIPLYYLPELTVVYATASSGAVWIASSLAMAYADPTAVTSAADYKPFEQLANSIVSSIVVTQLGLSGPNAVVTADQLLQLDQTLGDSGGFSYEEFRDLIKAAFVLAVGGLNTGPAEMNAVFFPMFPFVTLSTSGRMQGTSADDITIDYADKNKVDSTYEAMLATYFEQLAVNSVNEDDGTSAAPTAAAAAPATDPVPFTEVLFRDYFNSMVRGAINAMWQYLIDNNKTSESLSQLFLDTVKSGGIKGLTGTLSDNFRHGLRLPTAAGMTIPGGGSLQSIEPMYSLAWQQFPVGDFPTTSGDTPGAQTANQYDISLTNTSGETWVTTDVTFTLTDGQVAPYRSLTVLAPAKPVALDFLNSGPQTFSLQNAITWTNGSGQTSSLRQFPENLLDLLTRETSVGVAVMQGPTSQPFAEDASGVPASQFNWSTTVSIAIRTIPSNTEGGTLQEIYEVGGANVDSLNLVRKLLADASFPVVNLDILFQQSQNASGLSSQNIPATGIFLLRTNTTTATVPPPANPATLLAAAVGIPVSATLNEKQAFLQIVEQASATNAPGYYLRYPGGFPSTLFDGSNQATITLLISFASGSLIRDYYNAMTLTSVTPDMLYFAKTTDAKLLSYDVAVAPGTVGFGVVRDNPQGQVAIPAAFAANVAGAATTGLSSAQVERMLDEAGIPDSMARRQAIAEAGGAQEDLNTLYSLISYVVDNVGGFIASNQSLPVGPQPLGSGGANSFPDENASNDSDDWNLRVFAPLYKVAVANQGTGQPPNRYANIGDNYQVQVFLSDVFGNQLPSPTIQSGTQRYFDNLINFSEWQGINSRYDFRTGVSAPCSATPSGGSPQANTLSVYLCPDEQALGQLSGETLAQTTSLYRSINNQINGAGVSFYIQSTLDPSGQPGGAEQPLSAQQSQDIRNMIAALLTFLENGGTFNVPAVTISHNFGAGNDALPETFAIEVNLGIKRDTAKVAQEVLNDQYTRAYDVNAAIPQRLPDNLTLTDFAEDFQQAFPGLLLATGPGRSGQQSLWSVKQRLVDVTIGAPSPANPTYLALEPMDTELRSQTVPLPNNVPLFTSLPANRSFVDVDLDVFGRSFFNAVDKFLGAAISDGAFRALRSGYDDIAEARKTIADLYAANQVDFLFQAGSKERLTEAQEKVAQQLRAALASAYTIETVIQGDVTWNQTLPVAVDDSYALFGQVRPAGTPGAGSNFSFSTSSVDTVGGAGAQGLLTFTFGVKQVSLQSQVSLDLVYDLTHVQMFTGTAPVGGARPSIWLQLVDPFTAGPPAIGNGPTDIPVVLRQFPTPPTVIDQGWTQADDSTLGSTPDNCAGLWNYAYQYQVPVAAQDEIITTITYNTNMRNGSQALLAAGGFTLFEALARFSAAYPLIENRIDELASPTLPNDAAQIVAAFQTLVDEVAGNTTWNGGAANLAAVPAGTALSNVTDEYTISLKTLSSTQQQVAMCPNASTFSGPLSLQITALAPDGTMYPGQTSAGSCVTETYTGPDPFSSDFVRHKVTINNLNVLTAENARAAARITRNAFLFGSGGPKSRDMFIYRTAAVGFDQPITPFIVSNRPINVADETSSSTTLADRLTALFNCLLDTGASSTQLQSLMSLAAADDTRRIKIECRYGYPIVAPPDAQSTGLVSLFPVLLARSFDLGPGGVPLQTFVTAYAADINIWATQRNLDYGSAADPATALFVFDVTLYASLSSGNLPVLRLTNFQLLLTDIAPRTALV